MHKDEEELFDLPLFLGVLGIPESEHTAVHNALTAGVRAYHQAQGGGIEDGESLIPTLMAQATAFGYGVLEILADETISVESRKKIAYFACQTADPFARDHMPHGLVTFISFLAQHQALSVDLFRSVLLALALSGVPDKLAGWSEEWALRLTEWLLTRAAVSDEEKQWWLWYLAAHLSQSMGEVLLPVWAAHEGLPLDLRRELLWGWLMNEEQVGYPPANWRLMQATFAGDMELAEAISAEMNLVEEANVDETAVLADLENTPHIPPMPDHHGPGNDPVGFLTMLMGMKFGEPLLPPIFVRRFTVGALAALEGNPLELFQMLLAEADAANEELRHGVLDALPHFADGFTATQKRQLLDMGLIVSRTAVRQRLYELGASWFGVDYVQEALTDSAASIRKWAMRYNDGVKRDA
ncbi:MAG: hypothetical protein H6662_00745 [Ardenticatenaceae bacterium]|nr:hypothetical protein [Ardenticatenaceae bacterium]